ncbi:hypothetical protein LWP59_14695 [Amycolatopsis acidiphila]|nr:hypothetical protein [Amycolatopsis acidiphila]UIJ62782.1 hypothetical protein LWP59_14695 [Amycolatopsis acidiphila]GHG64142.1 hypothetical protein GCM10017788_20640 [Amycolatopsis acidiphila]
MSDDKDSRPEQPEPAPESAPVRVPPALLGDPELIVEVVRDAPPRDDRDR